MDKLKKEEIKQANKNTKNLVKLMEMANEGGRKQERRTIKDMIQRIFKQPRFDNKPLGIFEVWNLREKLLEEIDKK